MIRDLLDNYSEDQIKDWYSESLYEFSSLDYEVREIAKEVLTAAEYEADILGIVKNLVNKINEQR